MRPARNHYLFLSKQDDIKDDWDQEHPRRESVNLMKKRNSSSRNHMILSLTPNRSCHVLLVDFWLKESGKLWNGVDINVGLCIDVTLTYTPTFCKGNVIRGNRQFDDEIPIGTVSGLVTLCPLSVSSIAWILMAMWLCKNGKVQFLHSHRERGEDFWNKKDNSRTEKSGVQLFSSFCNKCVSNF